MGFFSVRVGLNSEVTQPQLIEALNREGLPFIQTSGGLCVKATRAELEKAVAKDASFEEVQPSPDLPADVTAFMNA